MADAIGIRARQLQPLWVIRSRIDYFAMVQGTDVGIQLVLLRTRSQRVVKIPIDVCMQTRAPKA